MGAALSFVVDQCLRRGPLATPDLERRPKIGERVSGAELPERLVEVETDDGQEGRRGDRREEHDVCRPIRPLAG